MQQQVEEKIWKIALQACNQHGCRLYDLYKNRDGLQVLIDKPSAPAQKVSIEDCENVFRSFSFLLGMEFSELLKSWRLEVSSPGIEKKLREKWHFEESLGEVVKIKTYEPVQSKNKNTNKVSYTESLRGQVVSFSKDVLKLEEEGRECEIPFSQIKSGQVVFTSFQFSKNKKSDRNTKKRRGTQCR